MLGVVGQQCCVRLHVALGRLNLKLFRNVSVHEFYRLKALITLEQVNTTEWLKKIKRILISKTAMVGCCKLLLYSVGLVITMRFIFCDH